MVDHAGGDSTGNLTTGNPDDGVIYRLKAQAKSDRPSRCPNGPNGELRSQVGSEGEGPGDYSDIARVGPAYRITSGSALLVLNPKHHGESTHLPHIDVFRPSLPLDPSTPFKVIVDSRDALPESVSHHSSYLSGYVYDMRYSGVKTALLFLCCRKTRHFLTDVGKPLMSKITQDLRPAVVCFPDEHSDTVMDILP